MCGRSKRSLTRDRIGLLLKGGKKDYESRARRRETCEGRKGVCFLHNWMKGKQKEVNIARD